MKMEKGGEDEPGLVDPFAPLRLRALRSQEGGGQCPPYMPDPHHIAVN